MDKRHPDPHVRRAQRLLQMVHELHKRGYQKLRIAPGMAGSGGAWRCNITPASNIKYEHGALLASWDDRLLAKYTSANENRYFGWEDATRDTARQLADKFEDRFPQIVKLATGQDWPYVGWFVQMLGLADKAEFPVAYADWYSEPDPNQLPTTKGFDSGLPMPPAGEAKKLEEY